MTPEPAPRPSPAATLLLVITAIALIVVIFSCQVFTWFLEQLALASASLAPLAHSGQIGLGIQGLLVIGLAGGLAYAFRQTPFKATYQSWLYAGLFSVPALALRFVDTNQDQVGALLQIGLALVASLILFFIRRPALPINGRAALTAFAMVPLVMWPFLLYGALGAGPDVFLDLLAGLALGLLAAMLLAMPADNFFLNGLAIGALLVILGSEYGYDGGQLLLVGLLLPAGFILAALPPSRAAAIIGIGLIAAAPLVFIDPTELSIVLGDFAPWATRAAIFMMGLELVVACALWALSRWPGRPQTAALPLGLAVIAWAGAFLIFFAFGHPGFYGDQLFVILKDQADVSKASTFADRNERVAFVYHTLTDQAASTQADIRQTLDRFNIRYKPYYLVNALEVNGGTLVRLYLAGRPEVDRVISSPHLRPLPQPSPPNLGSEPRGGENPLWNIKSIGADRVWNELGVTGQGIVIGNSDTGVQGDHPALRDSYRGLETGNDYNWYDPWEGSPSPNDQQSHGTHTTGTILGKGGIGVAPGAQWIACVNLERNLGNPAVYLDCLQFMLAPFPQKGNPLTDGDPTKAPHVLNNSWGCPPIEGCDANALKPAADALRAAGIFVVVSTGNDGPVCSTVNAPLALYDSVFSVGAVDSTGDLAQFSSRGPVTVDGSRRAKPDIAAPGVKILSSTPGSTYDSLEGTSMAGPHVVGVVALVWSANPKLIGDIDRTEQILRDTAKPYPSAPLEPGGCDPKMGFGAGLVDAYAAVKQALGK